MRRCGSCNRPLRNPESIELGYGPGCWSRLAEAERVAVLAARGVDAEPVMRPTPPGPVRDDALTPAAAPSPPTPTAPAPRAPGRSNSALAVLASWATMLVLAAVLLLAWRWVLAGLGVVAVMAVSGLVLERLDERARTTRATRAASRTPNRLESPQPSAAARPVRTASGPVGSTTAPVR